MMGAANNTSLAEEEETSQAPTAPALLKGEP